MAPIEGRRRPGKGPTVVRVGECWVVEGWKERLRLIVSARIGPSDHRTWLHWLADHTDGVTRTYLYKLLSREAVTLRNYDRVNAGAGIDRATGRQWLREEY